MENENKEVLDSKDEKETETPETNETTLTVDDYNKLLEEKKELEEKNAKIYARLKKESTKVAQPLAKTESGIDQAEFTKLKIQVEHGINDPDAIAFIMKNGGEEALKNPYVKKTIDVMLEQKKAEAATISDDNGKSEFEKKHTMEELKSMPSEELEKILPHA